MISSLELARRCGISQGTVDRALHNRTGVSVKTRERVLKVARQQGYRPHPGARELLTGQSRLIGAIVPAVNNIFFMDVFNELARELAQEDLRLQLTPVDDQAAFLEMLEDFAGRRYRMALVIPPVDRIRVPRTITASLPVVSLISPCLGSGTQFLSPDEEKTGSDAVRYLHRKGHRRILHLTYDRRSYAIKARTDGYRMQSRKLGLPASVQVDPTFENIESSIRRFKTTAIFCHNDWLALQTLLLLSRKGIRVPEDVSVIGVDNSPTLMTIYPGLTTMSYPVAAMVRAIGCLLTGRPANVEKERYHVIERSTVNSIG